MIAVGVLFGSLFVVLIFAVYRKICQRKIIQESIPLNTFDGISDTTITNDAPTNPFVEDPEFEDLVHEYRRVRNSSLTAVRRKLNFDG